MIEQDCNKRQFNRTTGKVCILTDKLDFIPEIILVLVNKETILVRVFKTNKDIDSLFNGYLFDSSSNEEEDFTCDSNDGDNKDHREVNNDNHHGDDDPYENNGDIKDPWYVDNDHQHRADKHEADDDHQHGNKEHVDNKDLGDFSVQIEEESTSVVVHGVNDIRTNKPTADKVDCDSKEIMTGNFNRYTIPYFWNNSPFDFVFKESDGKSGGILVVWDTSWFTMTDFKKGMGLRDKEMLWNDLTRLIDNHNDFSIILGDFNEVRSQTKRLGTVFYRRSASKFNDFIYSLGLCDLPMSAPDYGPTTFKHYNSWLDHSEFPVLLKASWSLSVFELPSTSPSSTSMASGFPLVVSRSSFKGLKALLSFGVQKSIILKQWLFWNSVTRLTVWTTKLSHPSFLLL
nr:hypothetical protein [Tanacetum cinerariifolium]